MHVAADSATGPSIQSSPICQSTKITQGPFVAAQLWFFTPACGGDDRGCGAAEILQELRVSTKRAHRVRCNLPEQPISTALPTLHASFSHRDFMLEPHAAVA
jgi:hypothetical protein